MSESGNPISATAAAFVEPNKSARSRLGEWRFFYWIAAGLCLLSLLIFFREFPFSGFNLIAGDTGDDRFVIAILEHWRAVVHGQASFTSPDFFWPEHGVLGYSESLFLFSLPYALARAVGLDEYRAFEITLIAFKAVGFFSILWLLRSFVGVARVTALVGSIIFTLSNVYFVVIAAGHAHLTTVAFIPLLVCFFSAAWRAYSNSNRALGSMYAIGFGVLLALILFTSFYIGWFALFAAAVTLAYALLAKSLQARSDRPAFQWIRDAVYRAPMFAAAAAAFLIAIVPFLITYLPTLKKTGGRTYEENLIYLVPPVDILNLGRGNWIWGSSLTKLVLHLSPPSIVPQETQLGWPPLTLALVAAGFFLGCRGLRVKPSSSSVQNNSRFLAAVLSISFLTCWLLTVKVADQSLWWLVYKFVPGGSAIRVPVRFNLVLNVWVVIVVSLVLDEIIKRKSQARQVAFWALAALLTIEQINTAPSHFIDRDNEHAIFARAHTPPATCSSFFLAETASPDRPFYANQIDAMLIARKYGLPTINGYSGWYPPGWDLVQFNDDYVTQVKRWTRTKHVTAGLCALNLRAGSWTAADFSLIPPPGLEIDFHIGGNSVPYEKTGWAAPEEGGTWAIGKDSVLLVNLSSPLTTDFLLTLRAHAFTPPPRPQFKETLKVNDSILGTWSITNQQPVVEKQIRVPLALLASGSLKIELMNADPRSPSDLKLSPDVRKLGFAVETLRIEPAPKANPRPKLEE